MLGFCVGAGITDPGPHACAARTLPTEPPNPHTWLFTVSFSVCLSSDTALLAFHFQQEVLFLKRIPFFKRTLIKRKYSENWMQAVDK